MEVLPDQTRSASSVLRTRKVPVPALLLLLPWAWVRATYRIPKAAPKAARSERRAKSRGTPSGQKLVGSCP